jgi:excisionase family DNA binding protein
VHRGTIYRLLKRGRIPAYRLTRGIRFDPIAVRRALEKPVEPVDAQTA